MIKPRFSNPGSNFNLISFSHVYREQNATADSLTKHALDLAAGTLVTQEFKDEILVPSVRISFYD
jgi:hypothetical protein